MPSMTFTTDSSAEDGYALAAGPASFTSLRNASGDNHDGGENTLTLGTYAYSTTNKYVFIVRGILFFDTSALPDNAIITAASLGIFGDDKHQDSGKFNLHVCGNDSTGTASIKDSDYQNSRSTSYGFISYDDFKSDASTLMTIPLNSDGLAWIKKTGYTRFSLRIEPDQTGIAPPWGAGDQNFYSIIAREASGSARDPALTIEYELPSDPPTVTTSAVDNISSTTATGHGEVTDEGDASVTARGVCYNTTGTPTTGDSTAVDSGTGSGIFSVVMTSLTGATTYYVRAYATNSLGTSYGDEVSFTTGGFTNPNNAFSSNNSYATVTSTTGDISVQLSGDAGVNYSTLLTETFTGSESTETYGTGSSELWGQTWLGSNVSDTNFRLRITVDGTSQVYKTFGFAPAGSAVLTGIEVAVEAKWDGATTSIDHIKVKIYSGTSTVPVEAGTIAYATDGATTGALAAYNGSAWKEITDTSSTQTLTNKTLTTPTIGSFANANHDHSNSANGGTIATAALPTSIWWTEIARTTLNSSADTITVSSIPAKKYLKIQCILEDTGGTISAAFTFNNDTGSNYAWRRSANGAADATSTSTTSFNLGLTTTDASPLFMTADIYNLTGSQKMVIGYTNREGGSGSGAAPDRAESVVKWNNTSAQISRIDVTNGGTGDYAAGSEIIVLGHD